jgi:hypothetical protein
LIVNAWLNRIISSTIADFAKRTVVRRTIYSGPIDIPHRPTMQIGHAPQHHLGGDQSLTEEGPANVEIVDYH